MAAVAKGKNGATPVSMDVVIPPLTLQTMDVRVVGDSPLIMHKWSEKAKQAMLDKQTKKARLGKEAKNPQQDFEDSIHRDETGHPAFPAVGFKSAMVDACSQIDGITKVQARGAFHVIGEWVRIKGEYRMRQDMVKIAMGTADIRFRAEFPEWEATVRIRYNPTVLSASQIVNLLSIAGFANGIGEWRPQRDGSYGMFHVAD